MKILTLFSAFWLLSIIPVSAQEDVKLFDFWEFYTDVENSMYKTSCELAFQQLKARELELAKLKTPDDYSRRQQIVKEKLNKLIGPLPEKTPLNASITGVIKKPDFRVEKVLFESIPGYYVTAALFLPNKRKGKLPAIIYASGHTDEGFRSPTYQHIILNLVKKGFAVFAFDPVGQGERWQYFDQDKGTRRFNGTTIEHSYPGAQCYISGYSPTNYFVWDGIRSVDYLLTRKEIDPARIGMTGRSGGGTQTAYTAAMDERILAAAPECFITKMEYILKSIGPQDAEQNIHQMLKEGIDHADLLEVRAPKPGLMITTTRDFFSIQGARETFQEVKQFYEGLGKAHLMEMVEDDDVHTSTKANREAMYAFFQKHLANPGSADDLEVEVFREQDLWVTETGGVAASLKSKTLFEVNQPNVNQQIAQLEQSRKNVPSHLNNLKKTAVSISGFEYPTEFGKAIFSGRYKKKGYHLEKYLVPGGGNYQLPIAVFKPETNKKLQIVLFIDEQGMDHAANSGGMVQALVQQGYSVVIADLPGIGSLGPGYLKGDAYVDNTSFNQWFAGNLTGKSIVAMRMEDIIRIINFIKADLPDPGLISVLSQGALGSELLHTATVEERIEKLALINPFLSYSEIATSLEYKPAFITSVVAGALKSYDLVDLMASLSPKKILIVNPVNASGDLAGNEMASGSLNFPKEVYATKGALEHFQVATGIESGDEIKQVLLWLK